MNSTYVSCGAGLTKFTGARGKSGSNDASAEFMAEVRKMFNDEGVIWQTGELGKVDQGGGGTVAKYIAKMNIDTVDIGRCRCFDARALRSYFQSRRVRNVSRLQSVYEIRNSRMKAVSRV